MDLIRIGQYIAGKRKALGLTQKQLAEKLGVSDKSVSKWERGVCLPDVSLYTELCAALGIGINEFLSGDDIAENDLPRRAEENILQTAADGKRRQKRLKMYGRCAAHRFRCGALDHRGVPDPDDQAGERSAPWKKKARKCRRSKASSPVWTEPICTAIQPRTIFSPCVYI